MILTNIFVFRTFVIINKWFAWSLAHTLVDGRTNKFLVLSAKETWSPDAGIWRHGAVALTSRNTDIFKSLNIYNANRPPNIEHWTRVWFLESANYIKGSAIAECSLVTRFNQRNRPKTQKKKHNLARRTHNLSTNEKKSATFVFIFLYFLALLP